MGRYSYAAASSGFVQELAASLNNEDVQSLAADLASTGEDAWLRWMQEHADEVADYVAATPGQRCRQKAWRDPVLRRRLVLAAVCHCLSAHVLQAFLAAHEAALAAGGSYRDTTARAGSLYWVLMDTPPPPYWPLEFERRHPSPFPEPVPESAPDR